MSDEIDVTGKPIPKAYIKVADEGESGSFLTLESEFNIKDIFPDYSDEKYILSMVYLTDEEYEAIPEFMGF